VEWVQQLNDPQEFLHSVKEDLFEKEVHPPQTPNLKPSTLNPES